MSSRGCSRAWAVFWRGEHHGPLPNSTMGLSNDACGISDNNRSIRYRFYDDSPGAYADVVANSDVSDNN